MGKAATVGGAGSGHQSHLGRAALAYTTLLTRLSPGTRAISRAHSIVGVSRGRPASDKYSTPEYATKALLAREKFSGVVWEPACADGTMSRVLEQALPHCKVVSSTIDERGYGETGVDFLKTSRTVDSIVTNPPYRLAEKFLEHSLECATSKVAMLLRIQFLEGTRRYRLFQRSPPKTVYVFSKRLTFSRPNFQVKNSGMICYAWFVWQRGYSGRPQIDWICDSKENSVGATGTMQKRPEIAVSTRPCNANLKT